MKTVIKNQPTKIEFGDYDNFATMIPIEILEYKPNDWYKVLIRWQYPDSERTIDLWHQTDQDVDFDSFNFKQQ